MGLDADRQAGDRLGRLAFPAGRLLLFVALGALWQSFFWLSEVPLVTRAGFFLLTAFAYARPGEALLVTAALATLGSPIAGLAGAEPTRGAEAIALAFLVGWLARMLVSRGSVATAAGRLAAPLLILGLLVVSSLFVTVLAVQRATEPAATYVSRIAAALATHYLGWLDPLIGHWYVAAQFVEGLLLCAAAMGLCRARPGFARQLVRMVVAGAAGAGLLSGLRLAMGMLRSPEPGTLVLSALQNQLRLTFHTGDVNAAGSHFVLALFLAAGLAAAAASWKARTAWFAALVPVFAGLWLSGSRTAMMAGVVAAFAAAVHLVVRRRTVAWTLVAAAVLAAAIVGLATIELPKVITEADVRTQNEAPFGEVGMRTGMATRWWFLQTSYRMWRDAPVFGVGIGHYISRSREFMPEPLKALYVSENAHNYYAQIAAELGLVGISAFVWLLWAGFAAIRANAGSGSARLLGAGTGAGLMAYLLTCAAGHPLLVEPAAYAFWFTFAASVAGFGLSEPAPESAPGVRRWVTVVAVALLAAMPLRVWAVRDSLDLSSVRYGFSVRQVDPDTGDVFRLVASRSTIFVPVDARMVILSLAAAAPDERQEVELRLDGRLANRVRLDGRRWLDVPLMMPAGGRDRRFRRLDIVVLRDSHADADSDVGNHIRAREVRILP